MISFSIIIFGLVATSLGSYNSAYDDTFYYEDSRSMEIDERITGGSAMEQKDLLKFNYQVGMYSYNKDKNTTICGGVIIHEKLILTAAHCVVNTVKLAIFMGTIVRPSQFYSIGNIYVTADQIIYHSEYDDEDTKANDIALIKLIEPVDLNNKYIGILPLATPGSDCEDENAIGWVSGWGRINNSIGSNPDVIHYLKVTPMKNTDCKEKFTSFVDDKQLCSSAGPEKKGICKGDSGGPYALEDNNGNRYLCGINSYGKFGDCINDWPKAYVAVAYYRDWICEKSDELIGCGFFS